MKKLILFAFIFAAVGLSQTTVTVTITVPSAAVPIADAYRKTLCSQTDAKGVCIQLQYPDLTTMLKAVIANNISGAIMTPAVTWAITTNDASLPAAIKTALTNATAAQVGVDAAKTAAALAAATTITVQ